MNTTGKLCLGTKKVAATTIALREALGGEEKASGSPDFPNCASEHLAPEA